MARHSLDHPAIARLFLAALGIAVVCRVVRRIPRVVAALVSEAFR